MRISGITNCKAGSVNGVYEPTAERCGGLPMYKKRGSNNLWLEYCAGSDEWQIKTTVDKGTDIASASVVCSPAQQLPQSRNGKSWRVYDGSQWNDQPGITVEEYTATMAAADTISLETLIRMVR